LQIHPKGLGITKSLVSGNIFRPLKQLIAGGIAYVMPNATTLALTMALKALLDPRKMHPKMMTNAVVRIRALSGKSHFLCTFAKNLLKGNPPSLAKA
jgi:hypothetical protein